MEEEEEEEETYVKGRGMPVGIAAPNNGRAATMNIEKRIQKRSIRFWLYLAA